MQSRAAMATLLALLVVVLATTAMVLAVPVDDAAATTTGPSSAATPAPGPILQAIEHAVHDAPAQFKTLQAGFRKGAEAVRERIQGTLARVIHPPAEAKMEATTKAHAAITPQSLPSLPSNKPPLSKDSDDSPTTPATGSGAGKLVLSTPEPARTLIGAPLRCKPGEMLDWQNQCRAGAAWRR